MERSFRPKAGSWPGILIALLLATPAGAFADTPPPFPGFRQTFSLSSDSYPFSIAAVRSLERLDDKRWRMVVSARNWLGQIRETTEFAWDDCIPLTSYYSYERTGLGRNRRAEIFLDQGEGQVRVERASRSSRYSITGRATDKLSQTLALQCMLADGRPELRMQVADERGVDQVLYRRLGVEWLSTPAGRLKTIKVEKVRAPGSGRRTLLWFALRHGHELVQMVQEEGDSEYKMVIRDLSS